MGEEFLGAEDQVNTMVVTDEHEEDGDLISMLLIMIFFVLVFVFNINSMGIRFFTRLVQMRHR